MHGEVELMMMTIGDQGGCMDGCMDESLTAHVQGVLRTNILELKRIVFFVIRSQNKYSPFFSYFIWAAGSYGRWRAVGRRIRA
jgi:hypothetical protein